MRFSALITHSKKNFLLLIAVLVFLAAAAAIGWRHSTLHVPVKGTLSSREAYWNTQIRSKGGANAYKKFLSAISSLDSPSKRDNINAFSTALYDTVGISGFKTCATQLSIPYAWRCYANIAQNAVRDNGFDFIVKLNKACFTLPEPDALTCQHGLGHVIQSQFGYSTSALSQALAVCKTIAINPLEGCYRGVFMEYNLRSLVAGAPPRAVSNTDPEYPCDTLSAGYQPACIFWSPQWLFGIQRQAGGHRTANDFAAIGTYCDAAGSEELIRDCYEGLGTFVPSNSGFDPAEAALACNESSSDPVQQLYCKAYAANVISTGQGGPIGDGGLVCAGLAGSYLYYCDQYAWNAADLGRELPAVSS